jgi:hypothetical protein
MTIQEPVHGAFAAPPQLPPPAAAYPVAAPHDLALPIAPVQELTPDGLGVRWDGTVLAPSSVMNAVYCMWAGAGLALLTGVVNMIRAETAVDDVVASMGMVVEPGLVGAMVTGVKVVSVVWALVVAGLWMWMASANGKGKGWARVVASVFFAVTLLGLLGTSLSAFTGGLVDLLLALPGFAVATAAVVLLWMPASSRYVATVRAARR